jgi:CPA2 family monovalent cation:H+ antiporter-2
LELDHSIQLFEVLVLLGLAAAGLALFERLKLPAIAGFLVIGAIAGPGVLGLVPEPERVRALAEIGVVFLLFEIGLDLPLDRIRRLWRGALLGGCLQVGLTMAVVYGFAVVFGMGKGSALILGGLITMSSTALVLRLLSDQGQLSAPHGQLTISILLFQDLSIVPLLLMVPLLADPSVNSASNILWAMARVVGGLGVVLFVVRFAVPFALDRMARLRSPDLFSILALLIVLGSAFLAEELGLTLAVGAFLAGVAASSSPYAQHLFSEVIPLRGVVLGIFFTAVGMVGARGAGRGAVGNRAGPMRRILFRAGRGRRACGAARSESASSGTRGLDHQPARHALLVPRRTRDRQSGGGEIGAVVSVSRTRIPRLHARRPGE